jgi:hypothetical protein
MDKRYVTQKMQTNAAWSSIFQFTVGTPPVPQDLSTWTLRGKCQRTNLPNNYLDLVPRMVLGVDTSQLVISLTDADTLKLGVGRIVFEVLRVDPPPQRPILRFFVENTLGVADSLYVMPVGRY